jgi:hypothetical protein
MLKDESKSPAYSLTLPIFNNTWILELVERDISPRLYRLCPDEIYLVFHRSIIPPLRIRGGWEGLRS